MKGIQFLQNLILLMISLIVHGGAWDIPDEMVPDHREGVKQALRLGWEVLCRGGTAIDAVEASVVSMENDESFDAGRGSFVNSQGVIELDASLMDGRTLRAGAVAAVRQVRNPVRLARLIMEKSEHVLLVGMGAVRFAREHGVDLCSQDDLIIPRELERWRSIQQKSRFSTRSVFSRKAGDTVGAVALDRNGNVASATSTGGVPNKHPGRVGDSPLIGCGTYADNEIGAVSTTGWGEAMIRVVMAKSVLDLLLRNGFDPVAAGEEGIRMLKRKANGFGGVVVVSRTGSVGVSFNTPRMAYAYLTSNMSSPVLSA